MGSCCESDNRKTKRIDDTAGGLVWVRRRNGSWWPGRILALDELPESYSVSPRAGTPVKLLGREDGSMDWYNLEKSKRIKAFRCGEYDECIEKARASSVQSSRAGSKERKYARREDAILHALELEQAHYMPTKQELGSIINRRNGIVSYVGLGKEQSHLVRKVNKHEGKSKTKLSQSKVPSEQKGNLSTVEVHVMQEERWKTQTDSEDDGAEGAQRMRGLQELGLGVVCKRKPDIICSEGPPEPPLQDNTSLGESNINNGFSCLSTINSSKEPCSSLKKRTQMAQAHDALKRKNRRRQLTKVLESSATVEVPPICCEGGNSSQSSLHGVSWNRVGVSEPAESKRTDYSEVVNGSLGSSETSCVDASLDAYEDTCDPVLDGANFGPLDFDDGFLDIPVVWKEIQTKDLCSGFAASASGELQSGTVKRQENIYGKIDPIEQDNNKSIDKGTSMEDSKGEKNFTQGHRSAGSRKSFGRFGPYESYLLGKPVIDAEGRVDSRSFDESPTSNGGCQQAKCGLVSNGIEDRFITGTPKGNSSANINCDGRGQVCRNAEVIGQADEMGDIRCSPSLYERETDSFLSRALPLFQLPPRRSLPRRQSHPTCCSCCQVGDLSTRSPTVGSALYDVKLEVKASYQGRRVPLISLMSKLNGKAIVGHPITVEALEDGYCNMLVRHCQAASSNVVMCQTLKENHSKRQRDMADDSMLWNGGGTVVKLQRSGCTTRSRPDIQGKHSNQSTDCSSLSRRKSSKIRKSGFLARKIRKLSSITVDCQHKEEKRKLVLENPVRPVTCVPLKLVFSRINEALSCPSRPENHV